MASKVMVMWERKSRLEQSCSTVSIALERILDLMMRELVESMAAFTQCYGRLCRADHLCELKVLTGLIDDAKERSAYDSIDIGDNQEEVPCGISKKELREKF